MYEELKQYLLSFGFSKNDILRILKKTQTREVNLIKTRIENYKDLLKLSDSEVRKMIIFSPKLLSYDVNSDSKTSVKGKINVYKDLLKLSDSEIRKMIITFPALLDYDTNSNSETSVKGKINAYKDLLKLSDSEIRKIIISSPASLSYDTNSESETSVKAKIKFYKDLLKLSDSEIKKIIISSPALLSYDTNSDKISSIKTKITKIRQIIPFEKLQKIAIQYPMIFSAPAQSFKIRYMLASIMDCTQHFFTTGFITNEKKVWARFCHLKEIDNKTKSYYYLSESKFRKSFGVSSEELIEKFPLDEKTVEKIEKTYYEKTGEKLTLDNKERVQLGIER